MSIRVLLELARIPNLPTVWSNILAVWLTSPRQDPTLLAAALIGGSALYTGGMFLNDACDVAFDREHRAERPIPSGRATHRGVLIWSIALVGIGTLLLTFAVSWLALLLTALILSYDIHHKQNPAAPLLMAACRSVLVLTVALGCGALSASIPHAVSLGIYVLGISIIARNESRPGSIRAMAVLVPPVLALLPALFVCHDPTSVLRLVLGIIVLSPLVYHLRRNRNIGATVSGLLAGIPWLDCWNLPQLSLLALVGFGILSLSAVLLRKVAPAT